VILAILFEFINFSPAVAQEPFLDPHYKEYSIGTIFERHFAEYDILDTALGQAWMLVEQKEYVKAHTVLSEAIVKLYKSPKTPRYIEERAIEENYLGLLIVADSSLSLAQGKVREAFNKFYAGNTLVSYSWFYDPTRSAGTIYPGFLAFVPKQLIEEALHFCFIGARAWLLKYTLEVNKQGLIIAPTLELTKQRWLIAPITDFGWYFEPDGKCKDKKIFERDLRWYLENIQDFTPYLIFFSRDDVPEAALFKKLVDEYTYWYTMKNEQYFAISVELDKERAYQFIEQYYGLR